MSDLQQLIHAARKAGWSVKQRHGGHLCWRAPNRAPLVFSASSPSDWRAQANLRASLRRAGLIINGDRPHDDRS